MVKPAIVTRPRIRFDRHEVAGSFGDIGTDLPLLVGITLAAQLDPASVFTIFGLAQILTGVVYGLPMPMQPLKAMAVIVISQEVAGPTLYGAGLAIGLTMLLLTVTGLLTWLAAVVPHSVVRGIQAGLGLSLASLALRNYLPAEGTWGYGLGLAGFVVFLGLRRSTRLPPGLVLIALGALYALFRIDLGAIGAGIGIRLPTVHAPTLTDVTTGFLLLALPQLPLSLSNAVIATRQTVADLFPDRAIGVRKIGFTYSVANIAAPFLSGVPVCHGSGGLAGHYAFGGRTGGSVIIYGSLYLVIGLLFSTPFQLVIEIFPLPILAVVLLIEALALLALVRDIAHDASQFTLALLVAVVALAVPHGFFVAAVLGTVFFYASRRKPQVVTLPKAPPRE